MKVAVVPAQITTIEDKIVGGLGLTQLILLVMPVFLSGLTYAVLPPSFQLVVYKTVIFLVLFITLGVLAIKVKDTLILSWLIVLVRYNTRPRLYIYNKNSPVLRQLHKVKRQLKAAPQETVLGDKKALQVQDLTVHEQFTIEHLINHPSSGLHFKTDKKGNLHVAINKVE